MGKARGKVIVAQSGGPTAVGAAKTIDKDLAHTDHSPGHGSAARKLTAGTSDHQYAAGDL